jgi:hypothetical protein
MGSPDSTQALDTDWIFFDLLVQQLTGVPRVMEVVPLRPSGDELRQPAFLIA